MVLIHFFQALASMAFTGILTSSLSNRVDAFDGRLNRFGDRLAALEARNNNNDAGDDNDNDDEMDNDMEDIDDKTTSNMMGIATNAAAIRTTCAQVNSAQCS